MGIFDQMGDPVCPPCVCQHHGIAYVELSGQTPAGVTGNYDYADPNTAILTAQIITTKACCITVNAAILTQNSNPATDFEIERPLGTIRTSQEDDVITSGFNLTHHAAWEVLPAGTYTYYHVNRTAAAKTIFAAWMKIIASDCEG